MSDHCEYSLGHEEVNIVCHAFVTHSNWAKVLQQRRCEVLILVSLLFSNASPITTAATTTTSPLNETVTLSEGSTGTLTLSIHGLNFEELQLKSDPSVTIRFQSCDLAFFLSNGGFIRQGFKAANQLERFEIEMSYRTDSSLTVSVIIHNVSDIDEGEYKISVVLSSDEGNPDASYGITATKYVHVESPTPQPSCYLTASEVGSYPLEVRCRAETSSRNVTISCFQNNNMLPKSECENNVESVFLMNCSGGVYCCSHELHDIVDKGSCHDFTWVPITDEGDCQTYLNKECGNERNVAAKTHFSVNTHLTYTCFFFAVLTLKLIIL